MKHKLVNWRSICLVPSLFCCERSVIIFIFFLTFRPALPLNLVIFGESQRVVSKCKNVEIQKSLLLEQNREILIYRRYVSANFIDSSFTTISNTQTQLSRSRSHTCSQTSSHNRIQVVCITKVQEDPQVTFTPQSQLSSRQDIIAWKNEKM